MEAGAGERSRIQTCDLRACAFNENDSVAVLKEPKLVAHFFRWTFCQRLVFSLAVVIMLSVKSRWQKKKCLTNKKNIEINNIMVRKHKMFIRVPVPKFYN